MATARPLVSVFSASSGDASGSGAELPEVFLSPIRRDLVQAVHSNLAKNHRQAYAVSEIAGEQTSAQSWGTGRAVSRIPRVGGSGTHRSGQGAFGNMCRGGRMFSPTKIWRRWHRKVNVNQRRYAVASAIAASGVVPLVMARGHRVNEVKEVPLVLSGVEGITRTKEASAALESVGALDDVTRAKESRSLRRGKGKMRNRRFVMRRGPLVVVSDADGEGVGRAFRNLAGVDVTNVDRLSLLDLAPGGHMGRFIVWSESAFNRLRDLFGSVDETATLKKGYHLPRAVLSNADLAEIINAPSVQAVVRAPVKSRRATRKVNPLRNKAIMDKLNPHAAAVREAGRAASAKKAARKRSNGASRATSRAFYRAKTTEE